MAWLLPEDRFDPDQSGETVVGVAGHLEAHDSGVHQHDKGQMLFTQGGCVHIHLPNRLCMLPPTRVAWIPPGTPHRAVMTRPVDYRSVYVDVSRHRDLPAIVEVLDATPLLKTVLERIATADFGQNWATGPAANLLAVCVDEIRTAPRQPMFLPLPSDYRLAGLDTTELPPPLGMLAANLGASEKTIGRIFRRETGMGYQQWRQQWRLLKAIELMGENRPLSTVAFDVGFSSDSSFIAFFGDMTGLTPRKFMWPES